MVAFNLGVATQTHSRTTRDPLGSAELDTSAYCAYSWSYSKQANRQHNRFGSRARSKTRAGGHPIMTKKEIVKTISEEIGLTQLKTKEIVQKTFDAIVETLVSEKRIELRNFGVFEVKKRAARKARNPRTGDKVFVPEKYVVTFKPGKEMEERVRQMERQDLNQELRSPTSAPPPPPVAPPPPPRSPPTDGGMG